MTNPQSLFDRNAAPIRTHARTPALPQILRPLKIGNVQVEFPIVQAALSGYSEAPMRIIARRMGAGYTLAEVMIDRNVLEQKRGGKPNSRLTITDEEHPVGGQLMGSAPVAFGPAARELVQAGFDVIDINFGCPVKTAMGGCRGGYHLGQPDIALEIVSRTRDAVPPEIPVTLKMRRGLDDSDESRDRFFQILDGAFARGISAITVHGRTVQQKYIGPSNWDFLRAVKQYVGKRTILGSGDLFTAEACLEMLSYTGVDGVTVARGAIGNPWIFSQVKTLAAGGVVTEPDVAEQRRVIELQLELTLNIHAEREALNSMRSFAVKFARLHPQPIEVRNAFARTKSLAECREVLSSWY